ncbi:hypothetical protein DENSPDRAFT_844361 [Dentipellis sp. KUC8613]|nr:hypothetical protein DENSPDRAFT_844361 [Dentipellis sp. KUC8613]
MDNTDICNYAADSTENLRSHRQARREAPPMQLSYSCSGTGGEWRTNSTAPQPCQARQHI